MNRLSFSSNSVSAANTVKMAYRKVTHCIFDMDGLLLDTESLYTKATQNILDPYDKTYTWDVKVSVMGLQREAVAEKIVEIYELPMTPEEYIELAMEQITNLMGDCNFMPGAKRLVQHLHSHNVPICVATSSGAESVTVKIKNHQDLFKLFHHKVMGSSDPEVTFGKPAPDIFLIAASRFPDNPDPEQCLVFEDAPNGVKAAYAADMQVVMVPDPHIKDHSKATLVLKSLEDFKPELFGLPPFEN